MLNTDLINIAANLFLGMSILGTIIVIVLFIIFKIFKPNKLIKILPPLCIIFCISWILNICCNIYLLFSNPKKDIEDTQKGVMRNIRPGTSNASIIDGNNIYTIENKNFKIIL
ncbi:hypothetical protein [Clostridium sp. ZS2-4]|uniref:hypothetical protein n=1 Tax=Clostridium sp. ZS2-4 TaxID=2987703 RepID=UPI002279FE88|nr:hypothetical protein [Clostridium sp. ZS2-4]MCY6356574.1 hypothetical protein [Clostridium sp. ZS2-4]